MNKTQYMIINGELYHSDIQHGIVKKAGDALKNVYKSLTTRYTEKQGLKSLTFEEAPAQYTYNGVVYTKEKQLARGSVVYVNKSKKSQIVLSYGIKTPYVGKLIVLTGPNKWSPGKMY